MNTYMAFYRRARISLSAATSFAASRQAMTLLKVPQKRIGELAIVLTSAGPISTASL